MDLVGMEACAMTMIEVAHQIRDHARVLVGSEELEPGGGWPYATILGDLAAKPSTGADDLGSTLVSGHIESYEGTGLDATQSAVSLDQLYFLVEVVDLLARRLLAGLKSVALRAAVDHVRRRTVSFVGGLYVDLHHLAVNLAEVAGPGRFADACRDIQRVTGGREVQSPLIAAANVEARMTLARGISIYFPAYHEPPAHYHDLDFA